VPHGLPSRLPRGEPQRRAGHVGQCRSRHFMRAYACDMRFRHVPTVNVQASAYTCMQVLTAATQCLGTMCNQSQCRRTHSLQLSMHVNTRQAVAIDLRHEATVTASACRGLPRHAMHRNPAF